ncbi:cupin domain-containing protein [Roseospira navarrensis]|uniref:Cupin domain-containing protein n=1 Tax=Roseospira navarrensis TaxID=140058 RepID=A0A7X1ZBL9_9PROT|nr:cupin domain-containing protein [Roseospira navarrensis]MQX35358.1 cupin domain-containing protein [Roseospira navarrensis]
MSAADKRDGDSAPPGNLFAGAAPPADGEAFETLLRRGGVHIERIVSSDRPDPVLYDQPHDEWVCLVQGDADLWIAGETVTLRAGDHRLIPAGTPHRVVHTSADPPCLWLAVHLPPSRTGPA